MTGGEKRRGSLNGQSKLTTEAVYDIRRRYRYGKARDLATEYGVNKRTITRIASGEDWSWLDDEAS